jgi:hypothetical protein
MDGDFTGTHYLESDLQAINERFDRYAVMILLIAILSLVVTLFLARALKQESPSTPVIMLTGWGRS